MKTIGPSEDRRSAIDLAIIREDPSRPQRFLRCFDGKAHIADALTKLHGDGDLLRAVCRQAFTVLVEAPEITAARRQERRERAKSTESQVTIKVAGACGRNVDTCDTKANCDLTRNTFLTIEDLPRHPAIRFKDKSEVSASFALYTFLWSFCYLLGFGTTGVSGKS